MEASRLRECGLPDPFLSRQETSDDHDEPSAAADDRRYDAPQPITVDASYIYAIAKFSRHFGCSPDRLSLEQVRAYQLHLIKQKHSWSHLNQVACALRFFYGVTLGQGEAFERIVGGRKPDRLPLVLNADEIARFLQAIPGLRNRVALARPTCSPPALNRVAILPKVLASRKTLRLSYGTDARLYGLAKTASGPASAIERLWPLAERKSDPREQRRMLPNLMRQSRILVQTIEVIGDQQHRSHRPAQSLKHFAMSGRPFPEVQSYWSRLLHVREIGFVW